MKKPNIILFDLETLPDLKQVMSVFPGLSAYPGLTFKSSINSIICFGYKQLGDKNSKCINAWDFKQSWSKNVNDDKQLCIAAREILLKADGVITHNGRKFDLPTLNSRLMFHGISPLPKVNHIDTCSVARAKLNIFSNRLNSVAKFLGCEQKLENGGWSLWEKVQDRDKAAQKLMTKYCKQDVEVLEQVFNKLRPLADSIPNYNLFTGNSTDQVCPSCGGNHLEKHGFLVTKQGRKQRWLCKDCGSNSTENAKKRLTR